MPLFPNLLVLWGSRLAFYHHSTRSIAVVCSEQGHQLSFSDDIILQFSSKKRHFALLTAAGNIWTGLSYGFHGKVYVEKSPKTATDLTGGPLSHVLGLFFDPEQQLYLLHATGSTIKRTSVEVYPEFPIGK